MSTESSLRKDATKSGHNAWLDVVRGLAILGVIFIHSSTWANYIMEFNHQRIGPSIMSFAHSGEGGVELFFFISGWLLASIYGDPNQPLKRSYWYRRIGRIVPLWGLFLGLTYLRYCLNWGGSWSTLIQVPNNEPALLHSPWIIVLLTMTFTLWLSPTMWNTAIGGGWSIQSEVGHYLVFPMLRKHSLNRILILLTTVNVITFGLFAYFRDRGTHTGALNYVVDSWYRLGIFGTIGFFIIGLIAYRVYRDVSAGASIVDAVKSLKISPLVAIFYSISFFAMPLSHGGVLSALGYVVCLIAMSFGLYQIPFAKKFLSAVGKYSYFMYFCHFFVLDAIVYLAEKTKLFGPAIINQFLVFAAVYAVAVLVSFALAIPSYKFFEKPIMKLARRFE
jgi:peptidoglycan/LPS O-acetylase OafA/YrhL